MSSRILLVSNFFPPRTVGGAEIVACRQAHALAARGHSVTVLAGDLPTESSPAGSLRFEQHESLPVYRLAIRSFDTSGNFYWPAAARRMKAILAAYRIDVVHFHNIMGLGANLIPAAAEAGVLCVVTLHDHWGFCFRQTYLRPSGSVCDNFNECAGCQSAIEAPDATALPMRLRRDYVAWCLGHADYLVTPSSYLATAYIEAGFARDRIRVVSNGIDLAAVSDQPKRRVPDGAVRFLCSAYLGEHKGVLILLEAIKQLAQDTSLSRRWHLTIAGEGHLRSTVESALKTGQLSENVRFVGRVPRGELLALLSGTDVLVLASIWPENEPVTLLEAIASGTAQIATRIGGSVELVDDMKSGLLVAPGDSADLAAAMRRYIDDPSLAAEHGAYNRNRRQEFDETKTIDKLEQIVADKQRAAVAGTRKECLVICGTGWPALGVGALTSHFHQHLHGLATPRFIWWEWADSRSWQNAALLWLWYRRPEERLVKMALRYGVPILTPANQWAEGLARHYGGLVLYRTYLEALAAIRVLLSVPDLRTEFAWRSRAASAAATMFAPVAAFNLLSETRS